MREMTNSRRDLVAGVALLAAFALWTALVQLVDVRPVGQNGTDIGFAAFNTWFHELTGVHMGIYAITDWLGLVLAFEMFPVNYRPSPIDGVMEASYPSSTTLLVLGVMPTLAYQVARRAESSKAKAVVIASAAAFTALMVVGRLVSGVHWATDIVGSVLLAAGLFALYQHAVAQVDARLSTARLEG